MEPPLGSLEGGRLTLPLAMDQEEREGGRGRGVEGRIAAAALPSLGWKKVTARANF